MKTRCILFGGSSGERLVSVATAQNILKNLKDSQPLFISKAEQIYSISRETLLNHSSPFTNELSEKTFGRPLFQSIDQAIEALYFKNSVVILALHGVGAEDGTLQNKFEQSHIRFTGSDSQSSALAFDKIKSKKIAEQNGVRVAKYLSLKNGPQALATLKKCIQDFERIAVKPVADGSSVGLQILDGRSDLNQAVRLLGGQDYMIEEFIAGVELTVGVVDDGRIFTALCPSEVRLNQGSNFNYDAKYLGKGVQELTPAQVSPEVTKAAQDVALTMHRALGCKGYSRTDLIVTREGPVYLETNTLPGMTSASFFPQQLQVEGRSIEDFFEREIERVSRD